MTPSAEVDRIVAIDDPVIRNLRITHSYHQLSAATARDGSGDANWCTLATWASKQAGQSIRQEDLRRTLDRHLSASSEIADVLDEIVRLLRRASDRFSRSELVQLLAPTTKLDRSSAAVAAGNLKVFSEIGRQFARYLEGPGGDATYDANRIEAFLRCPA